jgi:hypothetical protein
MTDVLSTLAYVISRETGLAAYPAPKPVDEPVPCLTFQMISDPKQDHNHAAGASLHRSRVQISHIGQYDVVRPLVVSLEAALEGNKVDFISCISDGTYFERFEGEDIWSLIKGYHIQWKA